MGALREAEALLDCLEHVSSFARRSFARYFVRSTSESGKFPLPMSRITGTPVVRSSGLANATVSGANVPQPSSEVNPLRATLSRRVGETRLTLMRRPVRLVGSANVAMSFGFGSRAAVALRCRRRSSFRATARAWSGGGPGVRRRAIASSVALAFLGQASGAKEAATRSAAASTSGHVAPGGTDRELRSAETGQGRTCASFKRSALSATFCDRARARFTMIRGLPSRTSSATTAPC